MRSAFATLAFVALAVATPFPAGVTDPISPESEPPAGCKEDYDGTFKISQLNVTNAKSYRRSIESRDIPLVMTLGGGVLKDSKNRTGYIAGENDQFQFDNPPQAGARYTAGFSVCENGTLALGGDAVFYSCLSGDFYNLYDIAESEQCFQVFLMAVREDGAGTEPETSTNSTKPDTTSPPDAGYPDAAGSDAGETAGAPSDGEECTEIDDGQPQCTSVKPAPAEDCSQIVDGQPQCATDAPTTTPPPAPVPAPAPAPAAPECSEIVDGQPQCPSGTAVAPSGPTQTYTGPTIGNGAASPFGIPREMLGLAAGGILALVF